MLKHPLYFHQPCFHCTNARIDAEILQGLPNFKSYLRIEGFCEQQIIFHYKWYCGQDPNSQTFVSSRCLLQIKKDDYVWEKIKKDFPEFLKEHIRRTF